MSPFVISSTIEMRGLSPLAAANACHPSARMYFFPRRSIVVLSTICRQAAATAAPLPITPAGASCSIATTLMIQLLDVVKENF
jgi:hypothetical protein